MEPISDSRRLLAQIPLFQGIPGPLLDRLAQATRRRRFGPGTPLFRQGDEAQTVFVVISGYLRLVQHTAEGKDVTMATFGAGDVIGLLVVLSEEAYPGTAEALAESDVLAFPGQILWDVMSENGLLAVRVLRMIAGRLHEAHARIRELSAERVQQRIARSLVRLLRQVGVKQPDGAIRLDIRLSRQDLAQLNGTTLETVSRTLTAWEQRGIIESGREQVVVRDPHTLVLIAEDLDTLPG